MKKYIFLIPLAFILALSYCRYTYVINLNIHGEPIFVNIRALKYAVSEGLVQSPMISAKSIIVYWVLFFMGNLLLYVLLYGISAKSKTMLAFFLFISVMSALAFGIHAYFYQSTALFTLASRLKNFLLSPMFTALSYLVVEYFQWFKRP